VDIAVANLTEIAEIDTQLVGSVRLPHEVGFVNTKAFDKAAQVRQRSLSNTDNADIFGFDQGNPNLVTKHDGNAGCRHPARCAAAKYYDMDGFWATVTHKTIHPDRWHFGSSTMLPLANGRARLFIVPMPSEVPQQVSSAMVWVQIWHHKGSHV
jgi:hypothetical protein